MHFKSGRYTKTWLCVCDCVRAGESMWEKESKLYRNKRATLSNVAGTQMRKRKQHTYPHIRILAKKHTVRHAETKKNTQPKKLTSMHEQLHM